MSALSISLTVFGQSVSGLRAPIASSIAWGFTVEDPSTRVAVDLTGATGVLSLATIDLFGNPVYPAILSKAVTLSDPTHGGCTAVWNPGDTGASAAPLNPGVYGLELSFIDGSGNYFKPLLFSVITLTPAEFLSTSPIPPPATTYRSQQVILANGTVRSQQFEEAVVTFDGSSAQAAATWESFSTRPFSIYASVVQTDDNELVSVSVINASITATGCTVQASAPFIGTVKLEIRETLS